MLDVAERGRKGLESASCVCVKKWDEEKRGLCQSDMINLGIGAVAGTKMRCEGSGRREKVPQGSVKASPAVSQGHSLGVLLWLLWAVLPWGFGSSGDFFLAHWCPAELRERQKAENLPGFAGELSLSSASLLETPGKGQTDTHAGQPNFNAVFCLKNPKLFNLGCGKALSFCTE